jgi:hypothetical protein
MAEYLLPCDCGEKTVVATAQAGDLVRCTACNAVLNVPTLRELRQLEPAGSRALTNRSWEDHHRLAFLLSVVALACLAVAGFLWLRLPEVVPQPTASDFQNAVDASSPIYLFEAYKAMRQGIASTPIVDDPTPRIRRSMLWGIGIAVALSVAAEACGLAIVISRGGRTPRAPAAGG